MKPDQVISLKQKAMDIPAVKKMLQDETVTIPEWIKRKGPAGKIARLPKREDIKEDINEQLIVEYYSR